MDGTVFFWVLPVMFAAFAGMFFVVGRIDDAGSSAKLAALAFTVGAVAIVFDINRSNMPYGFYSFAVLMHWFVIICMLNAFLARHGERLPIGPIAGLIVIGSAINFSAVFFPEMVAFRAPNVSIVAMILIALALPKIWHHARSRMEWLTVAMLGAALSSYAIRTILYFAAQQSHDYVVDPLNSTYARIFFFSSGIIGLAVGALLILTITNDLIRRHRSNATIDPLTGLVNRRGLDDILHPHARSGAAPSPQVGAVVAIDLDHFKRVNDRHGHAAGDRLLLAAARAIADCASAFGTAARVGGEEFVVLVDAQRADQARELAERTRAAIAGLRVSAAKGYIMVTASAGVAMVAPGETVTDAMERADRALYGAKRSGRDCVMLADTPPSPTVVQLFARSA